MRGTLNFETAKVARPHGRPLPDALEKRAKFYRVPIPHSDEKSGPPVTLRVMLATAASDHPRGSIIMCPGRTEFIEKYFETVVDLIGRGFNVLVFDPRGQGLSDRLIDDPLKSYVRDFQDYADDMAALTDIFTPLLPKPHILMGHSMGGCVALQAVISGVSNPSAVVCSAPMLGLFDLDSPLIWAVKALSALGMSKHDLPFQKGRQGLPVPFEGNKLTSDRARYDSWAAYFQNIPELRLGPPTYGWICAALRAMRFVNKNADKVKVPHLIIAAGGDPIVDPASNEDFARASGGRFENVKGAMHELFLERDEYRDQFLAHFDSFMAENAL
ncbi:alpha/beta fold hydrolase [Fretibacter rubidus]|uniref:alpha/beta fold hydrolase n=1 Tax=Fretibacter rubidus TaxID=570162 RepID=UPI00352AC77F